MRWTRIEPGYYRLPGTDITIANMKGQSVKYSGLVLHPWHVKVGRKTAAEVSTMRDAREYGEALYREGKR